jgi:hypothetical protein
MEAPVMTESDHPEGLGVASGAWATPFLARLPDKP